jgi:hypothetical protein
MRYHHPHEEDPTAKPRSTGYRQALSDGFSDGLVPTESIELSQVKTVSDLLDQMSRTAFGGRRLGEAAEVLLDRLGEDCHPLQFLRELTQNAIEAAQRTHQDNQIIWDAEWTRYELDGVFKLCIIDTGDGMTGEEMVKYINQLSSSLQEQSMTGNYGVGAKIAAATRNHAGLVYMSWKAGRGNMIHLWRDPETYQYGLRQFRRPDGTFGHYVEGCSAPVYSDSSLHSAVVEIGAGWAVARAGISSLAVLDPAEVERRALDVLPAQSAADHHAQILAGDVVRRESLQAQPGHPS